MMEKKPPNEMQMRMARQKTAEDKALDKLMQSAKAESPADLLKREAANRAEKTEATGQESPKSSLEEAQESSSIVNEKAPVYSYHCCFQIRVEGTHLLRDMILTLSEPITEANYPALKAKLAETQGYRDGNSITITSLTLI